MTVYEFYTTYILTGKALLTTANLQPLKSFLNGSTIYIQYPSSIGSSDFEIPCDKPITSLPLYGIKISLVIDPVYLTASVLTGVISIPLPLSDDLPF